MNPFYNRYEQGVAQGAVRRAMRHAMWGRAGSMRVRDAAICLRNRLTRVFDA